MNTVTKKDQLMTVYHENLSWSTIKNKFKY